MAQYRASVQGQRGGASRLGGKSSGISASVHGWHLGVNVSAHYNESTDCDVIAVAINGGSNGGTPSYMVTKEYRNAEGQLTGFEISEKPAEVADGA